MENKKVHIKDKIYIEGFNTPLQRDNRILELLEKGHIENRGMPNEEWVVDVPTKADIFYFTPQRAQVPEKILNDLGLTKKSLKALCNKNWCLIYTELY